MPTGYEIELYHNVNRIADALERMADLDEARYLHGVVRGSLRPEQIERAGNRLRELRRRLGLDEPPTKKES